MPADFPAGNLVPKAVLLLENHYGGYSCVDLSSEGSAFPTAVAQNLFEFRPIGTCLILKDTPQAASQAVRSAPEWPQTIGAAPPCGAVRA